MNLLIHERTLVKVEKLEYLLHRDQGMTGSTIVVKVTAFSSGKDCGKAIIPEDGQESSG